MEEQEMEEQGNATEEQAAPAGELFANPRAQEDLLQNIFDRMPKGATALSGAQAMIKPRRVSFIFDGAAGAPGVFTDSEGNYLDVEVTIQSLSSAEEIDALADLAGNAVAAPFALAKKSLYAIEGKAIKGDQKDFIWEAINQGGRQLCLMAFQSLGASSEVLMGKYQRSFTVC